MKRRGHYFFKFLPIMTPRTAGIATTTKIWNGRFQVKVVADAELPTAVIAVAIIYVAYIANKMLQIIPLFFIAPLLQIPELVEGLRRP